MSRNLSLTVPGSLLLLSLIPAAGRAQGYDDPPGGGGNNCQGAQVQATASLTFSPPTLNIQAGQSVKWCNDSQIAHNVKGEGFGNPLGDSWQYSYTFDTPGTYEYHCELHNTSNGMRGTIVVAAAPAEERGSLRFSGANYSVGEAGGSATITVQRTGGDDGAVGVSYSTSNGSATAGSDYTAASGTLSWADNDDDPKTFSVPITNDSADESNETVQLALSNPTGGASLGSPAAATLTITDNDDGPPGPGGAPAAPGGLKAVAASTSEIDLTWNDNSNNETQFLIEAKSLGGAFAQIGTAGAGATAYTAGGLPAATHRDFRVRAANSAGNSAYSNIAGASTDDTPGPCVQTGGAICVNNGRFEVRVNWRNASGPGAGVGESLAFAPDSGVIYFFSQSNLEMLVKVLNACGLNQRYWVFYAATTNVEFTLTVTDTQTGKTKVYFNPINTPAPPVQDTSAFATCP